VKEGVIELNGKRYDAYTGEFLGKSDVVPKHIKLGQEHARVVDGFVRPHQKSHQSSVVSHQSKAPKTDNRQQTTDNSERQVKPARHHSPQHSKTLMRRSVHRPSVNVKPEIKVQAPAELAVAADSRLSVKSSALSVNPVREAHAKHTATHQAIRHFVPYDRPILTTGPVAHVPVIAVRPVPEGASLPPHHSSHGTKHSPHHDHMQAAMHRATSHQQPEHKPKTRRVRRRVNTLAMIAAFLVIGGFVSYLNLPGLEMRVASFRAGFSAGLPGYTPEGYSLAQGPARSGGTITLSFNSGEQKFQLTQQSSSWNSQTLLDNTLALGSEHQTVSKNGQTVYIYDQGKSAAWVNGGVRYDLSGNAELSKEQIVQIATSL
jgi:hypothetical protein